VGDESRNLIWTAIPFFGPGYQNNHHAFPRSAFLGFHWFEPDFAGMGIRMMSWVGLAWNIVERPSTSEQSGKFMSNAKVRHDAS
jgi:stearoyl-CoA desaturase (delta-9 desaturase)